MHAYFIEWTSEGCGIKGAVVIAPDYETAKSYVMTQACPCVQELITENEILVPTIFQLGELS